MLAVSRTTRIALYVGLNILFAVILAAGYAIGGQSNPRILYLVLLFALCSTAVIDLDGINGRYSLLAIFLCLYFIYYGLQDLTNLFDGVLAADASEGMLSSTEEVILVGAAMLVLGYRLVVRIRNPKGNVSETADWPTRSIVLVGITMCVIGTAATYYWYFYVVTDKTMEGTKGIAQLSQLAVAGLILAQMLQPLSTLLLAYAWRSTKRIDILALVLLVVSIQFFFGFVIDIKGMALMGGLLVIFTITFTEGRIPKAWIAGVVVFIYAIFPVFQAYRAVVTGNVARTEVLDNFGKTLESVLAAKEKVNKGRERAQTFFERLSLKGNVYMIVHGTENGIPFQHGFTMTPILSSFVPKFMWSDKPDVPAGRILNKVFHVTDQEETYISPSHLGELYWNFGWAGVIGGMAAIGALCGLISRFNLAECKSVTRLLVMGLTVELVVHGFEGSLAGSYVVWLRSMAAVGLLHWVFARASVRRSWPAAQEAYASHESWPQADRFPNLLT